MLGLHFLVLFANKVTLRVNQNKQHHLSLGKITSTQILSNKNTREKRQSKKKSLVKQVQHFILAFLLYLSENLFIQFKTKTPNMKHPIIINRKL